MNTEFQIPMVSLIFLFILCIVYLSKKRINLVENKYFNIILIVTLIENVLNLGLHVACTIYDYDKFIANYFWILDFTNKILGTLFVIIFLSLFMYVLTISYKRVAEHQKKAIIFMTFLSLIFFIFTLFTNLEVINTNGIFNVRGTVIDFTFITVAIILAVTLIFSLMNRKKGDKRYHQIIYIMLLMIFIYGFVLLIPGLILYDLALVVLCYIMFFSIENPDIKLIKELDLAVDAANKANLAKSDFLSSMSHEIRTPLNAVVGLSQEMLDDEDLPKKYREDASDIVNASNTLLEIVGNIIDISKIESQKLERIESVYSIREIVDTVMKINETRIGEKDIKLSVNYAVDLPYELFGDKQHIKQILNNLLSNAVKYTEKGYIKVNVKSINKNKNCILMISVEDTGKGIKKEHLSKLYNKFERLDAEKNSTVEGTGLGLAITKKLVDLLGGKINVQSSFGYGSLFMVQLPQGISNMFDSKKEEVKEHISNILENKKVLIVDDNMLNIKVAKRICDKLNAITTECFTGKEAIEKLKNNKYDLILMDIMMPELSGEETFKLLKEDKDFNTPVIALTADAISGAESKYKKLGFDAYLSKPFSKESIEKTVNKIMK